MARNHITPPWVVCEQVMAMTGMWPLHRGGDPQGQAACVTQSMGTLQLAGGDMSPAFQLGWGKGTHESAYRGQTPHATQEQ